MCFYVRVVVMHLLKLPCIMFKIQLNLGKSVKVIMILSDNNNIHKCETHIQYVCEQKWLFLMRICVINFTFQMSLLTLPWGNFWENLYIHSVVIYHNVSNKFLWKSLEINWKFVQNFWEFFILFQTFFEMIIKD